MVVGESNRYAQQVMPPNQFVQWEKIDVADYEAYIGFSIFMGITHKPAVRDYWSKDPVYRYAPIADKISRDRFMQITRYLHYTNNEDLPAPGQPDYCRLGKVLPLLEYLQTRFSVVYNPGRNLAVDEAMIKFQGRSSLKQYMPKKPVKRGIKVWVLGDSTNGYFSRLDVYTGKKGNRAEKGLGARVVKDLTKDFQGKWHYVFFDNFFTSKALICDLEAVGIYGMGTARTDRKFFPSQLKTVELDDR